MKKSRLYMDAADSKLFLPYRQHMLFRILFILFIPGLTTADESKQDWRDTSGYRFPSLASTVAAAQNMAQAMILRDYCANRKLPDEFVRAQLERFSRITGRPETCQSLLEYERFGKQETRTDP